jgi:hypothetical protein
MSLILPASHNGQPTVFFLNGRGSYSDVRRVSLSEALAKFDRYTAWINAGNGGPADEARPEFRIRVHQYT